MQVSTTVWQSNLQLILVLYSRMISDPKIGMVENGAECGSQRVCIDGVCSALAAMPVPRCPTNNVALQCSGHGVSVGQYYNSHSHISIGYFRMS